MSLTEKTKIFGYMVGYVVYSIIWTIGQLLLSGLHHITYFVLYFMVYRFSGAHEKPTSDSSYDPAMKHQNNIFTKTLRYYENSMFEYYCVDTKSESREVFKMELSSMSLGPNNVLNRETFLLLTHNKSKPIVLKNFIKNSKACNTWSSNYFRKNYGETKLLTISRGSNLSSNAYTSFNQKLDCHYIQLGESINNMTDLTRASPYINNVTEIFSQHPELIDDLDLDKLENIDSSINSKTWLKVNMFMGGPGTGSSLHCAAAGNFFFNVVGKKKWILIDPKYSPYLQSTPEKQFTFVISGLDIENSNDFGLHNATIPKYEVILEPGDVLYVPPYWWHYVHNETDFTIGCAVRDHTVYWQSLWNNPTYFLMSPYLYTMNPFLLKIIELWKGRDFMVEKSMQSDKYIVESLTGEKLVEK